MYPTLPKLEIVAYFVLWFGFYGWAIIQVFLLSVSKGKARKFEKYSLLINFLHCINMHLVIVVVVEFIRHYYNNRITMKVQNYTKCQGAPNKPLSPNVSWFF